MNDVLLRFHTCREDGRLELADVAGLATCPRESQLAHGAREGRYPVAWQPALAQPMDDFYSKDGGKPDDGFFSAPAAATSPSFYVAPQQGGGGEAFRVCLSTGAFARDPR